MAFGNLTLVCQVSGFMVLYSAKYWRGKTLVNRLFQTFGKENVGEFTIAIVSYFSESGIWLGKILANDICFTKFAKVFPTKVCAIQYWERQRLMNFSEINTLNHPIQIKIRAIMVYCILRNFDIVKVW